jgi:acyl-CoA thioesterase FadM
MAADRIYWRGVFNQWQRGLGGHINIQHYAQALDEARLAAAADLGAPPRLLGKRGLLLQPVSDRIDFRSERAPGDAVSLSGRTGSADHGAAALNGAMRNEPDGRTVIRFDTRFRLESEDGEKAAWPSPPRSPIEPERALRPMMEPLTPETAAEDASLTWRGTVEVRDCNLWQRLSARGLYDIVTRALWAVNIRLGRHRDSMADGGVSGAVTALQVRYGAPARMGDLLEARTFFLGAGSTSVRLGHLIRNEITGQTVARVEYVTAFFDRTSGEGRGPDSAYLNGLNDLGRP